MDGPTRASRGSGVRSSVRMAGEFGLWPRHGAVNLPTGYGYVPPVRACKSASWGETTLHLVGTRHLRCWSSPQSRGPPPIPEGCIVGHGTRWRELGIVQMLTEGEFDWWTVRRRARHMSMIGQCCGDIAESRLPPFSLRRYGLTRDYTPAIDWHRLLPEPFMTAAWADDAFVPSPCCPLLLAWKMPGLLPGRWSVQWHGVNGHAVTWVVTGSPLAMLCVRVTWTGTWRPCHPTHVHCGRGQVWSGAENCLRPVQINGRRGYY
jgi:hypothetical protein